MLKLFRGAGTYGSYIKLSSGTIFYFGSRDKVLKSLRLASQDLGFIHGIKKCQFIVPKHRLVMPMSRSR